MIHCVPGKCGFENSDCSLEVDTRSNETWQRTVAKQSPVMTTIGEDHTKASIDG